MTDAAAKVGCKAAVSSMNLPSPSLSVLLDLKRTNCFSAERPREQGADVSRPLPEFEKRPGPAG